MVALTPTSFILQIPTSRSVPCFLTGKSLTTGKNLRSTYLSVDGLSPATHTVFSHRRPHHTLFSSVESNIPPSIDPNSTFDVQQLSNETTILIFIISLIPFLWASIEFWRRIAVGESFGTGSDSVVIGEDNNPESSRGRRVLGKDALIVAYILFGIAIGSVTMAVYSVISSPPM